MKKRNKPQTKNMKSNKSADYVSETKAWSVAKDTEKVPSSRGKTV